MNFLIKTFNIINFKIQNIKLIQMDKHIWLYRDEEIQLSQFIKLSSTAKQEHINYLLSLENNILSTNDRYILRMYGPANKIKQFLKITGLL